MTNPPPGMPRMPEDPNQPSNDDKNLALISHFGLVLGCLPALIIYLIKGDNPWVKSEAAKAFNFAVGPTIAIIAINFIGMILSFTDGFLGLIFSCLTCLIVPALWILTIVFGVINGIRTSNGEATRYPFEIPIMK